MDGALHIPFSRYTAAAASLSSCINVLMLLLPVVVAELANMLPVRVIASDNIAGEYHQLLDTQYILCMACE